MFASNLAAGGSCCTELLDLWCIGRSRPFSRGGGAEALPGLFLPCPVPPQEEDYFAAALSLFVRLNLTDALFLQGGFQASKASAASIALIVNRSAERSQKQRPAHTHCRQWKHRWAASQLQSGRPCGKGSPHGFPCEAVSLAWGSASLSTLFFFLRAGSPPGLWLRAAVLCSIWVCVAWCKHHPSRPLLCSRCQARPYPADWDVARTLIQASGERYPAGQLASSLRSTLGVVPLLQCDVSGQLAEVWFCVDKKLRPVDCRREPAASRSFSVHCGHGTPAVTYVSLSRDLPAAAGPLPRRPTATLTSESLCHTVVIPPAR